MSGVRTEERPDEREAPEPPLVASARERFRDSRLGHWARKHRSLAAAVAAVLVALKSWRWLIFDVVHHGDWLLAHWTLALAATGAFALVVFVGVRLGIGWFVDDDDDDSAADRGLDQRLQRVRDEAVVRRAPPN